MIENISNQVISSLSIVFLILALISMCLIPIISKILDKYKDKYKINLTKLNKEASDNIIRGNDQTVNKDKKKNINDLESNFIIGDNILNIKYENIAIKSSKDELDELTIKRKTDNLYKTISFIIAVIMSISGTVILFLGIIFFKDLGWITTASGAIVECIAGIYFWLINRTMKEVKENSKQLEKNRDLLTALELVEKITDSKTKNETYETIVTKLISRYD
ncbi:hypothetical protein [Porcipelethomonas sp.]|uniref:TRADD-N-associated membrane domain-containing protein n=1 Tax=Porcipelethomonas sp. TaxID=2981675 RepID=UPI003077DB93